jgi:hypothetical protein
VPAGPRSIIGPADAAMEGGGLLTIAALLVIGLISIPFNLARAGFRMWRNWRVVPLVARNHTRAGVGAFVLVALAIYTAKRGFASMFNFELYAVAGLAAFAALWLVVGAIGSQGARFARFDPMQIFWLGVICLGAVALLLKGLTL